MAWVKCPQCELVVDEEHDCRPVTKRKRSPSAASVARHRAKTGNAYGKAYAKARAAAVNQLIDQHPQEFAELLEKARIEVGLGPTTRG